METWKIIQKMADEAEGVDGSGRGWGPLYYHVMPRIINHFGFTVGAEIGVAFGGHACAILDNTEIKRLYCVDPYTLVFPNTDGYSLPNGQHFTQKEYEELYLLAERRINRERGPRGELIRETSHAAWAMIRGKLDFVFIDARHTYEDLYTDIHIWRQRVRPGGIVAGHDYDHPSYPGIKKAVDEIFGKVNLEDGYVWWTQI